MAKAGSSNKIKSRDNILDYILLVVFIFIIILTLYPFLNVLAISFNDPIDTMRNINFIFPRQFTLSNYTYVFKENDLMTPMMLSVARTLLGAGLGVVCTAMLAYVLSRKDFYFNKPFTILFVITMYVSGGLIPEYLLLMRTLKMGNNFLVYIIPGLIWVYNIILVRSFIEGLPIALQEAARVDGANAWQMFKYIQIPAIMLMVDFILFDNIRGALQVFDIPFVITGGGPGYASSTFTLYTIDTAFKYSNFGLASTMAVAIMIMIVVIYVVQDKIIHGLVLRRDKE